MVFDLQKEWADSIEFSYLFHPLPPHTQFPLLTFFISIVDLLTNITKEQIYY